MINNITISLKPLFLLAFICSQASVFGQSPAQIKKSADKLFKVFAYENALTDYKKIEANYINNINLKYQMGVCFFHLNRLDECIEYLDFYTKNSSSFKVKTNYYLARSYHLQHKFRAAALYYKRHLKSLTKKDPERAKFKNLILQCTNGPKIEQINSNAIVSSLGEEINTSYDEYKPCFNQRFPNMVYFSSNREIIDTTSGPNYSFLETDIYKSELLFGNWSNITPLSNRYNSKSNEELVCFFDYGYQMLFLKEISEGQKEIVKDNFNNNSDNIILPFALGANSNHWDGDHFFATDSMIIFSSNRPGGYGGKDLYFSVLSIDNTWSKAVNLGPKINSINDEISPFLARDGHTLYYSSNNISSMGGFDIYKSIFNDSTKKWSTNKNLGTPVNSAADDKNFIIADDGLKAYFDSDRIEGKGGFDLYSAYFRDFITEHLLSQQNNTFIDVLLDTNNVLVKNNRPRKNRYPRKTYNSARTKTIYNFTPIYYNAQTGESEGSRNTIVMLSKLLNTHEDAIVVLSGHSDNTGIPFNDLFLSIKQTEQLAKELIKNGANNKQIWLQGYGQNYPVANSLNFDKSPNQLSNKMNRRIQVNVFNIEHLNDIMKVNYINPRISDALQNDAYNDFKNQLKGLTYKIQITETPNLYNHSAFDELSHPTTEKQPNDINIKYLVGLENSFSDIKLVYDKAITMGLANAKIIPYIDGLRITEKEAQTKISEYKDLSDFLEWKAK
ncbi:MAG: OmpA family protein [Saprospiraceae bacterium]|nr:OmpA family protein [Saprospiraceae bacterium]